ncbi:hypothetical protein H5410_030543 [Solanum commersonii]|uniref:Uncharacterized protein n=1 Tax=Solanum commersonii TaxID=4109 RepID=A0A9J5YGG5_SOLCO|nr:hypothetical protein H5410_030543 [Solanum commersonii]
MSNAFFAKLWSNFRISASMWSAYMWNKYNKNVPPTHAREGENAQDEVLEIKTFITEGNWDETN